MSSLICLYTLFTFLWINNAEAGVVDVCPYQDLKIECSTDEVIVAESALFGRMQQGRCIREDRFIGCQNDVLFLADRWCSGRPRCEIKISINELEAANSNCEPYLKMYLSVKYHCLKVSPIICNDQPEAISGTEGVISSHIADNAGCGTARSPLTIRTMSGQRIELSIIDFGSETLKANANKTISQPVYGKIKDAEKDITIKGNTIRERQLHTSLSNQISIEIFPPGERNGVGFLLLYKKLGCPDLSPPAHAWYKRDGDQAVIGCEWSQKTWHLSCDGYSWSGVVGNCSEPVTEQAAKRIVEHEMPSVLWLVCVVSVSVVLMVVACVIGIVCIRKYRIKQDIQKSMRLKRVPGQGHYDLDPNIEMASMLYLPYKISEEQQQKQQQGTLSDPHRPTSYLIPQDQVVNELTPIRIWERPLPDIPVKPLATCGTVRSGRTPGDGDEAVGIPDIHESTTLQSQRNEHDAKPLHAGPKYSSLPQQVA